MIFIFFGLFGPVLGLFGAYTNYSIQLKQEKYDRYMACVKTRNQASLRINDVIISQRFFKAVSFPRDSSVKLNCFVCLAPDSEDDLEEIWKPNDSFIGRSIRILKNKINEALQKLQKTAKDNPAKTTFEWEYMPLGKGQSWKSVIDLKEPLVASAKAKKVVESFVLKSEANYEIGDHFELEIFRANHSKHSGFYRCVRKNKKNAKIEQLYFVDISTEIQVKIREFDGEEEKTKVIENLGQGVEAVWTKTPWGPCNKCGDTVGEQRRRIQCVIRASIESYESLEILQNSEFSFLLFFDSVPCSSSLVPLESRKILKDYIPIEEFRICRSICPYGKNETRVITDVDEEGRKVVKDELPPDEFSMDERLPPLKPTISRKIFKQIEGNMFVLDCGHNNGDIFWKKDFIDLTSGLLLEDSGRRYINHEGQLVFLKLQLSDAGFYSCLSPPDNLHRTFHLYISESNKAAEWISWIQILIRYFTGFFIIILIIKVILKTKTNTVKNKTTLRQNK